MSPLTSWLFLAAVLITFVGPAWRFMRHLERRHVPFCVCDGCMAVAERRLLIRGAHPSNGNGRASLGGSPVVAHPDSAKK